MAVTISKAAIYYFSATGNSLKLAQDIASAFPEAELTDISTVKSPHTQEAPVVGFVFPIYWGGLPKIVRSFLENFQFRADTYYFAVGTYYVYRGGAMSVVGKIINERGARLRYANSLPTVGNTLMEYEVPAKKRQKILARAEDLTAKIVDEIYNLKERHPYSYCHVSDKFHKWLFKLHFGNIYTKFALEPDCVGCGLCAKICPVNIISLSEGKPHWNTNCEACHACVHWCPKNAITIGKSKGRLQYHNPSVKRAMMLRER